MKVLSSSGNATVSLTLGTSVVYDKQGPTQNLYIIANGLLIARLSGNNKFFHHQDHLGKTRLVTKGSQTEFSTNYKPFGPQYGASGTDPVYKYTGKPQSSGTQLYYYGARWYNSTIGRFLTRDPSPGRLSNPQSLNLYAYVLNNPLRYVDPTGNRECAWYDAVCHGSNVVESASNAWNSLPPEYQQGIILAASVALVVATGGAAAPVLLAVGAARFGAGVGAYLGYSYATGGKPTLAGALTWGNAGFAIATVAYGGYQIGARLLASRASSAASLPGSSAASAVGPFANAQFCDTR